ncbi:undecaprenyl-diphosphatase [Bacillus sp. CGMCC 1.16607]|uniref:undecaprenyl-diphosphatase n=1 Tax=Bacillus sp. CGMCC 1.16607 TaxID=3351842 RepID=UPI00362FFF01
MSLSQLNIDIFRSINDIGKQYDSLNPIAVFIAEYMLYILCFGVLCYWLSRTNKNRMMIIQSVLAVILAEILGKISGKFHSHFQPFAELTNVNKLIEHSVDNSFPSDHTIIFFSICFSILLVRKEGWLWLLIALFVGISRIWVGVHYPVDVLVGALYGIISASFIFWLAPKLAFLKQLLAFYEKVEQAIIPRKSKSKNQTKNF